MVEAGMDRLSVIHQIVFIQSKLRIKNVYSIHIFTIKSAFRSTTTSNVKICVTD